MSGTASEVGYRVVSGVAIGAGGVIGPAYCFEQWPERSWERELQYDCGSSCSAKSIGGEVAITTTASPIHAWGWSRDWWKSKVNSVPLDFWGATESYILVGRLGPDSLLYHPTLEEVSGQRVGRVGALFQHVPEDEDGGVGVVTSNSQASESSVVWGLEGSPEVTIRWLWCRGWKALA